MTPAITMAGAKAELDLERVALRLRDGLGAGHVSVSP
jgi:hypothetical protein